MLDLNDFYAYIGEDEPDEMIERNAKNAIRAADAWMKQAVGDDYPADEPEAIELVKMIAADLYDNRGINNSVSGATRQLVNDFTMHLRLGLRG